MTATRIVLGLVLLGFIDLTAYAVWQHGFVGFFELALANWATRLVFADLVIALALILVWMYRDARAKGASFAPYALVTAALGSAGPLLYLIRRQPE